MPAKPVHRGERGFTLLEMLVAFAIVLLTTTALTRTLVTGMVLSTRAARETRAFEVARNALSVAEGSGAAAITLTTRLDDGFERRVTVRPRPDLVNPAFPPALSGLRVPEEIDVVVRWRDGARVRDFTLSSLRLDARL